MQRDSEQKAAPATNDGGAPGTGPAYVEESLDAARHLAEYGVPIFVAKPAKTFPDGGTGGTGNRLPKGWQRTEADPAVVDGWKPGDALCAVMGHAIDGLDLDPRSGGSLNGIARPESYGRQATPSGGTHDLIAPLGVGSRDAVVPGVDVKAGDGGKGHGFLFLAPTEKVSKVTGEVESYRWVEPPDLSPLLIDRDDSGAELAQAIRAKRGDGESSERLDLPDRIPDGERNTTLSRYACSLAGRKGLRDDEALVLLRAAYDRCDPPYTDETPESMLARAEFNCDDQKEEKIEQEVERMEIREAARERFAAQRAGDTDLPKLARLDDFLAVPDEDAVYRIDGLWPVGGRVLFAAPQKAGKTTMVGNLLRSLSDGDPFLDQFEVDPVQRILLLDNELDERMMRRWLRDHEIDAESAVEVMSLRGRLSTFNVLDPTTRSRWAKALGPADVLVFDCLRPLIDSLGLSEQNDAGRVLEALDELTTEAGIGEAAVVHHMGHNTGRARGDSQILAWPDALWNLVRENEDEPMSPRFFSAYGRDVEQREVQLGYNDFDRRLWIAGGSRSDARTEGLRDEILAFVAENPGSAQRVIEEASGRRRGDCRKALQRLVAEGSLTVKVEGRAHRHYVV